MALSIETATPYVSAPSAGTVTTASFTVAPDDLIIACGTSSKSSTGISDSASGIWSSVSAVTDTAGYNYTARISARVISSGGSLQVTHGGGGSGSVGLLVYKVTSFLPVDGLPMRFIGDIITTAHGQDIIGDDITVSMFTSTADSSLAIVAAIDMNLYGPGGSSDLTYTIGSIDDIYGYKSVGAVGAETCDINTTGSSVGKWMIAACEIKAGTTRWNSPANFTGAAVQRASGW